MNIVDVRNQMPFGNPTRKVSDIKKIARHHSATISGDVFAFLKHWLKLGWKTGGYHEVILRDGTVQLCYNPSQVTNGVKGHNTSAYNICVVGNGSFTAAQEKAFNERSKVALESFNLKPSDVIGHNEFSGQSTQCPGIDMKVVRKDLESYIEASKPKPKGKLYKVQVGAFGVKANAERLAAELKSKGYQTYIVEE